MDPDEAHYAQLTREMLQAGNWMIPLLDGLPYIDKPVLFHWLQGLAIAVLGETEAAMRLPSALAAIALFWMTRWTGAQLFDERVGVRAWLMLATMPLTFMLGSIGVFDMVFTAFLFGAIAFATGGRAAQPAPPAVRVVCAAEPGGHDQGPRGAACWRACSFSWDWRAAENAARRCSRCTGYRAQRSASLLSLPWFVWMYFALGWQFVHQYALAGNLYYVTQPQSFSNRAFNHTLYLSTFLAGFFPWSIVDARRRGRCRPPMAGAIEDSAGRDSAVGVGGRRVRSSSAWRGSRSIATCIPPRRHAACLRRGRG